MKKKHMKGISACVLTLSMFLTFIMPSLAVTVNDDTAEEPLTVSMEFVNADIRDVLSALAINLDSTLILTIDPKPVSFKIKDVTPDSALDLFLKTQNLDYITSGNTIIIGSRETLANDFFTEIALTKFSLKYVPSEIIASQIDNLGIPVQKITLDTNQNSIWIQGLPQDLGKVRELITMLDRSENGKAMTSTSKSKLTAITLTYINAYDFNDIIVSVGLEPGIYLESNPKTLYVYANTDDLAIINELKQKIDTVENKQGSDSNFTEITLTYIQANEIIPLIYQFGLDIDVISFSRRAQSVWLLGDEVNIKTAQAMISKIDVAANIEDKLFYIHKLTNITALEAVTRLEMLDIPEIKAYTFGYPQLSKSIMVVCPQDYKMFITSHINQLDVATEKIRVPVDYSDVPGGYSLLTARRDLLVTLTGIPASSFTVTQNVSREESFHYLLILEETPEKIKMVEDMITKIDAPTRNEYEPEYQTVID